MILKVTLILHLTFEPSTLPTAQHQWCNKWPRIRYPRTHVSQGGRRNAVCHRPSSTYLALCEDWYAHGALILLFNHTRSPHELMIICALSLLFSLAMFAHGDLFAHTLTFALTRVLALSATSHTFLRLLPLFYFIYFTLTLSNIFLFSSSFCFLVYLSPMLPPSLPTLFHSGKTGQ